MKRADLVDLADLPYSRPTTGQAARRASRDA
jgi:hypothetical protein